MDSTILLTGKNKTTKSLILKILIMLNKITITDCKKQLKKQYNKNISYQAIRQALTELEEQNILIKKNKLYSLDENWILDIKENIKILEKSLNQSKEIKFLNQQTTQINLKNMYEFGHFILYSLEEKYFDTTKDNNIFMAIDHLWIPFGNQEKRERLANLMKNNNIQVIIKSNSFVDKILKQWYKKHIKLKLNKNITRNFDYIIHQNNVIQIYFPKKLRSKMNQLSQLKNLNLNILDLIQEVTYEDHNIQINIIKNKKLANELKEKIKRKIE